MVNKRAEENIQILKDMVKNCPQTCGCTFSVFCLKVLFAIIMYFVFKSWIGVH